MVKRLVIGILTVGVVGWILTPPKIPRSEITYKALNVAEPVLASPVPTHPKDIVRLPSHMLCPHWAQMAIDTGWQEEDLPKLDAVMHRESRCFTTVHYKKDPHGGSYGLMQVNAFWCKPSRYYPSGYLQALGLLESCKQLFHPRTNLLASRAIYQYSLIEYGDGWLPWQK